MKITTATPADLQRLLDFRKEAASWISALGSDQRSRPYPAERLLTTMEAGTVFMLRDGDQTAATITLTPEAEEGLWSDEELAEPSMFVNKLTVSRDYAGQNLGGALLDWAGDRAYRAGGAPIPTTVDPGRAEQTRPRASRSFVQWRAPPGRPEPRPLHGVWVDGGRDGSWGEWWVEVCAEGASKTPGERAERCGQ
ncbi:hypothetical protein ACFU5D_01915 [Streptomyces anthocyanicus]|uniref:hypothetical protein n=1 Tax=Streptomyces anthocyanicus TaxID=68174 RepID=UPI0036362A10